VEIDVWDGEPHTPDSSDGEISSESSSDSGGDEKGVRAKVKQKLKSKTEKKNKPTEGSSRSVSTKLGDTLNRKSAKAPSVTATETADTGASAPAKAIKGEPRVLHGHTLTKGTSFREICYAIRDSAFIASDLPVIVSFEVHANLEQQQIMVDIINEAWKGILVEVPSEVDPEKLPALGDLKKKILIKTKSTATKAAEEKAVEKLSEQAGEGQAQEPSKPSKVLEALAKMAVYTPAYHFSHFDQPGMAHPCK